jgi:glycosyltransferase involved in cell wall biosynthesis
MGCRAVSAPRRPVRVVHITTLHHAQDIRIFQKEALSLARAGYEVAVVAPYDGGDTTIDGVRIASIPRYWSRVKRMTLGSWHAFRRAWGLNAAVYHFHDPELLPWMALLRLRGRVVYDMHENLPAAILTKPWIRPWLRKLAAGVIRGLERLWAGGMWIVFAEDSYRADYPWARRSTTVLNMPHIAALLEVREPKRAQPTVVYFGSVSASRGSVNTLHALALLKQRGLDVHFECVGYAPEAHLTELRQLAAQLGVSIALYGYTLPRDGWRITAQCHVGLALLHPLPNYVDSYPTKIFEYMALGLPVIASDFPLYRGIVEDDGVGVCIDPLNVELIADTIQRLLTDSETAAALGVQGRQVAAEKYNWDTEAGKLLALYAELTGGPA